LVVFLLEAIFVTDLLFAEKMPLFEYTEPLADFKAPFNGEACLWELKSLMEELKSFFLNLPDLL
jgi:hypothetical protein